MDTILFLAVAGIGWSIAYLADARRRQREQRQAWRLVARRAKLADVIETEGGLFESPSLSGRAGTLEVRFEDFRGEHERGTRILVSGLGHGAGGLSLRHEGLGTAIETQFIGEREIETGDAAFDAEYYVQGAEPLALAILEPETRRRLSALLRGQVADVPVKVEASLQRGVLEVKVRDWNRERTPEILERVLEVAQLLVAPPDLAARIAANLPREPEAAARLNRLLILVREFKDHAATRKALRAARQDPSEEVRLRAAMALGNEGRETLLDLVDHATSDSCTARAVEALGHRLSDEVAEAALRRALSGAKSPQTADACLTVLGRRGPGTERLLREALGCEDEAIAVAAARALGRAGTVASVVTLREAGERRGALRGAARQAIADIQSRLAGAEPGQLSLATGAAGALSLADGEPGSLDLVEAPASSVLEDAEKESDAKPPLPRSRETG